MKLLLDEKTLVDVIIKMFSEAEMMGTIPVRHSLPEIQRRADKILARLQDLAADPYAPSETQIDLSYQRMIGMIRDKYDRDETEEMTAREYQEWLSNQ